MDSKFAGSIEHCAHTRLWDYDANMASTWGQPGR